MSEHPSTDRLRALSERATPPDKVAQAALNIIASVRSGQTDPRKAAELLGLPYDQDMIMAIMERAAQPEAAAVGEGWALVPREPTEAMLLAKFVGSAETIASVYGDQRPMFPSVVKEMWRIMVTIAEGAERCPSCGDFDGNHTHDCASQPLTPEESDSFEAAFAEGEK